MAIIGQRGALDHVFEQVEGDILPSLSLMLDNLIDAAMLARTGIDAELHAAELRMIGKELESLTKHVEAIAPRKAGDQAPSFRISA